MKIAVVLNTSWNIYNFRMGLVDSFLKDGHEVYAIAPKDKYSHLLEEKGCAFIELRMDSRGANPLKDFLLILELYRIYKMTRPDIILHFTIKPNIYGSIAARLLHIPVINNVCGLGTIFLNHNLVSLIAKLMYRFVFRFPKCIFFQNPDDLDLFVEMKLVKPESCRLLPGSGINLEKFKPSVQKKRNLKFTFLMISRLIYDKGVMEYVEAARMLKEKGMDAVFQILGQKDPLHKRGIPVELIDDWIHRGFIEYLGTSDDIVACIERADCVALPSYREGAPRSLLEAGGMAKPVIASDVPGCRQVVEDKVSGFLCKPRDAHDLADKMYLVATMHAKELEKMGGNGRLLMKEKFDEKIVINQYHNRIKEILDGDGSEKD